MFNIKLFFYSKHHVHFPLVNGNSWYLISQATIRGPLLLAQALHVVQVQVWRLASSFVAFLAFLVVLCGFVILLPASRGVFNI